MFALSLERRWVCCEVHAVCFIGLLGHQEQNICTGYHKPHALLLMSGRCFSAEQCEPHIYLFAVTFVCSWCLLPIPKSPYLLYFLLSLLIYYSMMRALEKNLCVLVWGGPPSCQTSFPYEVVFWPSKQTDWKLRCSLEHSVYEARRYCNPSNCLLQAPTYVKGNYLQLPLLCKNSFLFPVWVPSTTI